MLQPSIKRLFDRRFSLKHSITRTQSRTKKAISEGGDHYLYNLIYIGYGYWAQYKIMFGSVFFIYLFKYNNGIGQIYT